MIFLGGIMMLTRTAALSTHLMNPFDLASSWETYAFVLFYLLEACLKMFGLGPRRYFSSGWNLFDFSVTAVSLVGLSIELFGRMSTLVVARHLR